MAAVKPMPARTGSVKTPAGKRGPGTRSGLVCSPGKSMSKGR